MHILHHSGKFQQFCKAHVRLQGGADLLHQLGQARQHTGRYDFGQHRFHKLLLTANTANIAFTVTVTHILDSLFAVQMLLSGVEVNDQSAVIIPRVFIIHALFHIDVHAVQCVNNTRKGLCINDDVMVHRMTEQLLHGLLAELMTAISVSMIYLLIAIALDSHPCITGHRQQSRIFLVLVNGCHHHGITAAHIAVTAVYAENQHPYDIVLLLDHIAAGTVTGTAFILIGCHNACPYHYQGKDYPQQPLNTFETAPCPALLPHLSISSTTQL